MAGLDLQVFEGRAHLDPEVKRGPGLKKTFLFTLWPSFQAEYEVLTWAPWPGPLLPPPSYLADYMTMRLYTDLNCQLNLITDEDKINHAKEIFECLR